MNNPTVETTLAKQSAIDAAMDQYKASFQAHDAALFVGAEHGLRDLLNNTADSLLTQEQLQVRAVLNGLHADAETN